MLIINPLNKYVMRCQEPGKPKRKNRQREFHLPEFCQHCIFKYYSSILEPILFTLGYITNNLALTLPFLSVLPNYIFSIKRIGVDHVL